MTRVIFPYCGCSDNWQPRIGLSLFLSQIKCSFINQISHLLLRLILDWVITVSVQISCGECFFKILCCTMAWHNISTSQESIFLSFASFLAAFFYFLASCRLYPDCLIQCMGDSPGRFWCKKKKKGCALQCRWESKPDVHLPKQPFF